MSAVNFRIKQLIELAEIEIPINADAAELALDQARRFVQRMSEYLVERGFWDETTE